MEFGSRRGSPHPELAQHLELAMWVFGPRRAQLHPELAEGIKTTKRRRR
jgi:hypothetical protein